MKLLTKRKFIPDNDIEPGILSFVNEFAKIKGVYPNWSCEGHPEQSKIAQVWFHIKNNKALDIIKETYDFEVEKIGYIAPEIWFLKPVMIYCIIVGDENERFV